jgi:hypothetical protein
LQEHWLFDCQLNLLNEIHQQYTGVGKAVDSNDPITPLRMPRGYGGTAILWRKDIDTVCLNWQNFIGYRIQNTDGSLKNSSAIFAVF